MTSLFWNEFFEIIYKITCDNLLHSLNMVFEGIVLREDVDRIFVERMSGNYLPSVRTSKGI